MFVCAGPGPDTRSKRKKARAPSAKAKKAATAGDSVLAFLAHIPLPSAGARNLSPLRIFE